ncbi:styrene monooxygenase subunit StyA [Paraglaciecola chathamensis]|uniref:Styrene monooxygenase large component n=1 Tax=Paraglaciecola agarilytica NO2 TaxID=1125747 RepID=A0ABQ0IA10_9ALTE|nr:styrene monooxygenase/indole monooxygenase family protein [Paraglaciecola agarilytica]GAC06215.1 styrene monooxygenase large component [Paraglaciecola agarilytica NO2]
MSKRIAIVGAGAAGLHLGIYLRKHNVDVTLFTDRRPDEYADCKLLNTVAHHSQTIEREEMLGINHWPESCYFGHYYYVGGPQPLRFYGDLKKPSRAVDYRVYLPTLMKDFVSMGGQIEYGTVSTDDLELLSENYDLVSVCVGKYEMKSLFDTVDELSPFDKPQRALCVGLFKGIAEDETRAVTMSFSPMNGELIEIPTLSFDGMCTALVFENHIGGDLEILANINYDEDPRAFLDLMLDRLEKHHTSVYERIDRDAFDLVNGSKDLLQGAVTPVLREGATTLKNGKQIIGLGDIQATVDPVLGQGANMATYSSWIIGEEIVKNPVFDQRFFEHVENRRHDRVQCATRWTNYKLSSLASLPQEFMQFIGTMSQNRAMADEFTDNFNYPERQMDYFSSPDRIMHWCATYA